LKVPYRLYALREIDGGRHQYNPNARLFVDGFLEGLR